MTTTCTERRIPRRVCPEHGVCHRCGGTRARLALAACGDVEICCACHPALELRDAPPAVIVVALPDGAASCPICGGIEVWPVLRGRQADGMDRCGWVCARCYPTPANKVSRPITVAPAA